MESKITLESIIAPSEDIITRVIEDEMILIPIATGIGDMEDELYTLNQTGAEIWNRLDGTTSLGQITAALAVEYHAPLEKVESDVLGLVIELAKRHMVLVVS
jgi:hypothetical protein